MAMNQKQRDHFIDRVREKCSGKISALKALHAGQIQAVADEKYQDFVSSLGLQEDMDQLKTAERIWDEQTTKIQGRRVHPRDGPGASGRGWLGQGAGVDQPSGQAVAQGGSLFYQGTMARRQDSATTHHVGG